MTDRESEPTDTPWTATAEPVVDKPEEATEPEAEAGGTDAANAGPLPNPPEPGPGNPSPDGQTLAYLQRDAVGMLQLWLSPLAGGEPSPLSTNLDLIEDAEGPQWSPDGAWLAVAGGHPADGRSAIWLVDVARGTARLLVDHPGADREPRWSPDGEKIGLVSRRADRDAICVAWADGTGPAVQLADAPVGQDDRSLTWSNDGQRIAFCRRSVEADGTVGDQIWVVDLATAGATQVTKKAGVRHSLRWAPNRALIAYVSDDGEWENIAVVNPDNSAGWNLASEFGDKADPRWSADGNRVLYTRLLSGVVRVCERGTNAASAEAIDPGHGVASAPRWLPDQRVVYRYAPETGAPRFVVQEPKLDAERTELPPAVPWAPGRTLVEPTSFEFDTAGGLKLGGFIYRQSELAGPVPGVLYLGDRPDRPRDARFRAPEQALAAAGFAVFAPSLPGTPGCGRTITNALRDVVNIEAEVSDLVDAAAALRSQKGIDGERIAVVGRGHGGALALLLAGGRPGTVQAVVAIDPIADWDLEFDQADDAYRAWHARNLGLPAAARGHHALRTPETFVGVIDVPLLLLGTDTAPPGRASQLDALTATMQELDRRYDQDVSLGETEWATTARAARFLRQAFPVRKAEPAAEALSADAV